MSNFGWLVPRKVERVSGRFRYNLYHKVKTMKTSIHDSTWLKHLKTSGLCISWYRSSLSLPSFAHTMLSVNVAGPIVRGLEMLRNSLQLWIFAVATIKIPREHCDSNKSTTTQPHEVSNWKRWLSGIQPTNLFWLSILKFVSFSEKKSSKDGEGRTPNSAETSDIVGAHVLAEGLAARAWNERFKIWSHQLGASHGRNGQKQLGKRTFLRVNLLQKVLSSFANSSCFQQKPQSSFYRSMSNSNTSWRSIHISDISSYIPTSMEHWFEPVPLRIASTSTRFLSSNEADETCWQPTCDRLTLRRWRKTLWVLWSNGRIISIGWLLWKKQRT